MGTGTHINDSSVGVIMLKLPIGDSDLCEDFKDEEIESLVAVPPVEEEGPTEQENPPQTTMVRESTFCERKKNTVIKLVLSSVVALLLLGLMVSQEREHDVDTPAFEFEVKEANDVGASANHTTWNAIPEKADLPSQNRNSSDIITMSEHDVDMPAFEVKEANDVGVSADYTAWIAIWEKANLPSQNKNSSDIISSSTLLNKATTAQELFDTFPAPARTNTIQIYNEEAYNELINVFLFKKEGGITICANGGSSTAGGGHIKGHDRYLANFRKYIRELNLNVATDVAIINRGHGTRHSLHSAVFATNFLPPQTDLLLWEFSINDYANGAKIPEGNHVQQERSMLIAWLCEVEKMHPKPPKVVLIYLWKSPFEFNEKKLINDPVYEAHAQLAKEFDFVVGHINLASYFDELHAEKMLSFEDLKGLFLADAHHPNVAGHMAVSFLLLNLLSGKGEWSTSMTTNTKVENESIAQPKQSKVEKYDWFCGNETEDKIFIQNRIVEGGKASSGWRSPLRSMTLETPTNWRQQLELDIASPDEIKSLGKQDPVRIDRQGSVSLACCPEKLHSSFTTIKVPTGAEPMQNVQAIFFAFGGGLSNMSDMKVYIDSDTNPVIGKLINVPHDWPCFWTWYGIYDTKWFAFSEEQPKVSSTVCVESKQCDESGKSDAMMISMAVYA